MKTNILLIRHAQSVANLEHIIAGVTEFNITNLGYKQIENLTNRLKDIKIDEIYSSNLSRAKETIKPIATYLGKEIKIDEKLRELNFGIIDGMKDEECEKKYKKEFENARKYTFPYKVERQEILEDAGNRIYNAIEKIANENIEKTIAITSHGAISTIFLAKVLKVPFEEMYKMEIQKNTNINFLEYENETKEFKAIKIADNEHNSKLENSDWKIAD